MLRRRRAQRGTERSTTQRTEKPPDTATKNTYRVTHQVVPKLLIRAQCNSHRGPESRVREQPDVSPSRDEILATLLYISKCCMVSISLESSSVKLNQHIPVNFKNKFAFSNFDISQLLCGIWKCTLKPEDLLNLSTLCCHRNSNLVLLHSKFHMLYL